MPLRQTKYGGVCPLGKFEIDIPAGAGCYTADSVEACVKCNFADLSNEKFDLEKICQCPVDMTWKEYIGLNEEYLKSTENRPTRQEFWEFVNNNYLSTK